jgi:signal transduction histidine kinase
VTRFRLLDQVKSNLVATVSNELKTPLTSIQLDIHVLLDETVGPLTSKQVEFLMDARENADLLLARVNSLLDLTRLEGGREQLEIRPEQPADLVRAAADAIRPKAEDKGVGLVVEMPSGLPAVAADATRLEHALGKTRPSGNGRSDRRPGTSGATHDRIQRGRARRDGSRCHSHATPDRRLGR